MQSSTSRAVEEHPGFPGHGCRKDPLIQGAKSVASRSGRAHPTPVFSSGAAGSGAAPGDEQPMPAGFSVQHLGVLPAFRAQLLSNKCAPHQGTNVTPEISQVNPVLRAFHSIAAWLCPCRALPCLSCTPVSKEGVSRVHRPRASSGIIATCLCWRWIWLGI